jgi:mitochondrial fission protein ELM1
MCCCRLLDPVMVSVRPLEILLLTDGVPGHYHCADAIADAIQTLRQTTVVRLPVTVRTPLRGRMLSWLLSKPVSPEAVLKLAYKEKLEPSRPDLIVSAGGDTMAANVALHRLTGAPNIFFGSLRRFDPRDFTLILNCYSFDAPHPNKVRIIKPSPADPTTLPAADLDHRRLPRVAGLLVGGPSGDARFDRRDWSRLTALLSDTRLRLGVEWIVSNSRRTPAAVSDMLASLAADPSGPVRRFIDVRKAGHGTLRELFADSGAVAITADSSAMLSEAIWMRRPAISLRPKSMRLTVKELEYRQWLERRNLCRALPLADVSPDIFASALREIVPLAGNPQSELATTLAEKVPFLFRETPAVS